MKSGLKMSKVLSMLIVITMLASLVMTGCSKSTGEKDNSSKAEVQQDKKVTLTFFGLGQLKNEMEYFKSTIQKFKSQNPNVEFEETYANDADLNTKMNVAFAGGSAPDIIYTSISSTISRAANNQLEPLDGYMSQWGGKDKFLERNLQLGTYKSKLYAIGLRADPRVLLYRKDFFKEVGLDPEKPPKTWEEFADYAVKLTKKENGQVVRGGADIPTTNGSLFLAPFIFQNGGKIADEDNDKLTINSPEAIEALKYVADLYKKGVSVVHDGNKLDELPFVKGKSAMSFTNLNSYITMTTNDPTLKDKIGFSASLERKSKAAQSGLICLSITKDSKYKKEASNFLSLMLSDDETWSRYQTMGVIPIKSSLQDKFISDNPKVNQVLSDSVKVGITRPRTSWGAVYMNYEKAAYEAVVVGNTSAEESLATLEKNLNKAIQK